MSSNNQIKISLSRYAELIGAEPNSLKKLLDQNGISPIARNTYDFNDIAKISRALISPEPIEKKVISSFIAKGGTGKTTTTYNLAMLLGLLGYKVLLFDIDPQCNLSKICGLDFDFLMDCKSTVYDIFLKNNILDSTVAVATNVDIVPGDANIFKIDVELSKKIGQEMILKRKFEKEGVLDHYDFVIADNNSSPGIASTNFLFVSDLVLSSVKADEFTFDGVEPVLNAVETVNDLTAKNIGYKILLNDIPTNYKKIPDTMYWLKMYKAHYGEFLMESFVRSSRDFSNSITKKEPFFSFAGPRSNAVNDYIHLVDEIVEYVTVKDQSVAAATPDIGQEKRI